MTTKRYLVSLLRAVDAWRGLPLLLFVLLPVLVVRTRFTPIAPDAMAFWRWSSFGDTRSWWKAVFVMATGGWMVAHALCRIALGWRPTFRRFGLLAAVAAILTLAASLNSDFPRSTWLGATSLYEGACVLLAYIVAIWYIAEMVERVEQRRALLRLIGGIAIVEGVHGIFEGCGFNIWMTGFGRWLKGDGEGVAYFNFAGTNMAYGTVFQPNHYGMLMTMLSAFALGMVFSETVRRWKCFWGVTYLLCIAGVVFSNSRTALGICGVFLVLRVFGYGFRAFRRNQGGVTGAYAVLAAFAAVALSFGLVLGGIVDAGRFGEALRGLEQRLWQTLVPAPAHSVESVELKGNAILLYTGDKTLQLERRGAVEWEAGWVNNGGGKTGLDFSDPVEGWREARLPDVANGLVRVHDRGDIVLRFDNDRLGFFAWNDVLFAVDHKGDLYGEKPELPSVRFGGLERYLGGRGQTWGKALALFRKKPLLGYGPGTFPIVFPNHEILMKKRYLDNIDEDKAHAVWASLLVHLGLLGTVAYAAMAGYVFYRRPWKSDGAGLPLVMGMSAYLLSSITNDSTVGVTPLFCVLAGLALSSTRPAEKCTSHAD